MSRHIRNPISNQPIENELPNRSSFSRVTDTCSTAPLTGHHRYTDLLGSENRPERVAFRVFNALVEGVLNIGRLGHDLDAIVAYYMTHNDRDDASIPSADPDAVTRYYVNSGENGRWVGKLRDQLGVDGTVDAAQFRRLLEGRHPLNGAPLTPGAVAEQERMRRVVRPSRSKGDGEMLTVSQAASRLGVGERQVRKFLDIGRLVDPDIEVPESGYLIGKRRSVNRFGPGRGKWSIPESELTRFENERRRGSMRPGFDLTLRPPKSVSILWALGKPEWSVTIAKAHREAVDEVIDYYECDAVFSRKRVDGEQLRITTNGIIGAAFDHRTSRAGDPLLHTHVVTFNLTECSDEQWRSLDGTPLYEHAKAGGYLYQAHLRYLLSRELGVQWTQVVNGCAEIDGIPQKVIDVFSKRRDEIESAVADSGNSSAAAYQAATMATRRPKGDQSEPPVALAQWHEEARAAGLDLDSLEKTVGRQALILHDSVEVSGLFDSLIREHGLTEMQSTFGRSDVIQASAEWSGDGRRATEVRQLAKQFVTEGGPIALSGSGKNSDSVLINDVVEVAHSLTRYSTVELLNKESQLLEWSQRALTGSWATASKSVVEQQLKAHPELTHEQVAMVRAVTQSGCRLHLISGAPGSGKTHALSVVVDAFSRSGIPVVGAALSADAGDQLESSLALESLTGRRAGTLAGLIGELNHPQFGGFQIGTVLVVDEASMVGTRVLHELIQHLDIAQGSLILMGDPDQHGSVEAGGMYAHLVRGHRDDVVFLNANNRQTDEVERRSIKEYQQGRVRSAIEMYEKSGKIIRCSTATETYDRMVADWYIEWRSGDKSPMIAGPNSMRLALNARARQALMADNKLGAGINVGGKEFCVNDWIVAKKNKRALRSPDGRSVINGSVGQVIAVDSETSTLTVEFEKVGKVELPSWYMIEDNVDYAYARTTYGVQGKTTTTSNYKPTDASSFEEGYVAITRARSGTRIYMTESDHNADVSPNCHDGNQSTDDGLIVRALERRRAQEPAVSTGRRRHATSVSEHDVNI